jgi:hypothetical protein
MSRKFWSWLSCKTQLHSSSIRYFLVILALLLLAGCDSDHSLTFENATKPPSVLRLQTATGDILEVTLSPEIDPATLIALNGWITSHQIQGTTLVEQQTRQANLTAIKWALIALCLIALTAVGVIAGLIYRSPKGGESP